MQAQSGVVRRVRLSGTVCLLAGAMLLLVAQQAPAATANSFGIVSGKNDSTTVNKNTTALKQVASTFVGNLTFPDGATYFFNDVIPFHDGVNIDLMGSTLSFSKSATSSDAGSGFIFAIRNFSIANGKIDVNYDGTGVAHAGNALKLGQRWSDGGTYFQPSLDSNLSSPMGNIVVSNLTITSNNPNAECGISLTGGLQNVQISNVTVDGESRLICGIYYEFGQATQPIDPASTPKPAPPFTSHAHQMAFSAITVKNLNPTPPTNSVTIGFGLGGAYDTTVDGLTVTGPVSFGFFGTAGEAAFYKMWPSQVAAQNRTVTLRNVTVSQATSAAMALGGAGYFQNVASCGSASNPQGYCGYLGRYLDPSSYTAANETDELNYVVDGFNLTAASGSSAWGVSTNARSVDISNGTATGFQSGFLGTDDCTMISLDNVKVFDSLKEGMRLDYPGIYTTPRSKSGYIKFSTVAGSGTSGGGAYGIEMNHVSGLIVEYNNFGYPAELFQTGALNLGSSATNVLVYGNHVVVPVRSLTPVYANATAGLNLDVLQANTGRTSAQGIWTVAPDPAAVLGILSIYLAR